MGNIYLNTSYFFHEFCLSARYCTHSLLYFIRVICFGAQNWQEKKNENGTKVLNCFYSSSYKAYCRIASSASNAPSAEFKD